MMISSGATADNPEDRKLAVVKGVGAYVAGSRTPT